MKKYLSVKLIFHFLVHSSYVFRAVPHRIASPIFGYFIFLQEYLVNLLEWLDDIYYLCSQSAWWSACW
jgi:hypothetical protein